MDSNPKLVLKLEQSLLGNRVSNRFQDEVNVLTILPNKW